MRFDLAAADIVAKLAAVGVTASVDPRDLNPPCVWVDLSEIHNSRLPKTAWSATWALTLIVPDIGTALALAELGKLCDLVRSVFGTISNGTKIGVQLPAGGDPLPGVRFMVDLVATDQPPEPVPGVSPVAAADHESPDPPPPIASDSTRSTTAEGSQPNESDGNPDDGDRVRTDPAGAG